MHEDGTTESGGSKWRGAGKKLSPCLQVHYQREIGRQDG